MCRIICSIFVLFSNYSYLLRALHTIIGGGFVFVVVRAKRLLCLLCLTIFLIGSIIILSSRTFVPVSLLVQETDLCYIIDAGHGGEDGGAVAQDGTVESTLNLAISSKLEQILRFLGQKTQLTRRDENAVYSSSAHTLREKKRSDLENRVAQINSTPHALLISIHQNSLPASPQVHGAQVFYNQMDGADALAQSVQSTLNRTANAGNEKECKAIDASIYLMRQAACSAILVECGFLSNAEETRMLKQNSYQTMLAMAIAAGVLNHRNGALTNESE